jgi:hypothetical protein
VKNLLPRFAFALVAVLIIAGLLITLGKRESEASPSAYSYNPSGLHALEELLHRNGIETTVSRLVQPLVGPKDLVIAAYVEEGPQMWGSSPLAPVEKSLKTFISKGGRVLVIPFDRDFRARSYEAIKGFTPVVSLRSEETLQINSSPLTYGYLSAYDGASSSGNATFLPIEEYGETYSPWYRQGVEQGQPFVSIASEGKGLLARTSDGLFVTNRFIDQGDNARLALQTIKGLLPEGGRVVFAEAALGGGISASLVSTLGPWAVGIWMQLLVLFVVVIFTLGIRFGLPLIERRAEYGQREMIDAISDVYVRARSSAVALDVAYQNADFRIRRALKLPAHLSIAERDRFIPDKLASLLKEIDLSRKPIINIDKKGRQKVSYRHDDVGALNLVRRLETELDAFVPKTRNRIS